MLGAAIEQEEEEWEATIAYYARYYAVYALFRRCGIISEIHDCTIVAFGYLFVESGIVAHKLYEELVNAKDNRIDAQYYVMEEGLDSGIDAGKARAFVLAIEEVLDKLAEETIEEVRHRLSGIR